MDIKPLFDSLPDSPIQGDYIGNDCYKIRLGIASKGKGKRGGARVITCVKIVGETVFCFPSMTNLKKKIWKKKN